MNITPHVMAPEQQGYLTIAVEKRRFLEMAVDLALSMRQFDDRPLALAADAGLADVARSDFPGVFASIHLVDPAFIHHRASKFCAAEVSPFEETVYLDADCLILDDPEPLWSGAGSGPITMTGAILTRESRDWWHQGFSSRELMARFQLDTYLKSNGGVFHFRRDGAAELLKECHEVYQTVVLGELWDGENPPIGLGDEFAFAIVGGRRGFDVYPNPVPTHWIHEVVKLDLDSIRKPVLHFTAPVPRKALDRLMEEVRERRRVAGLPPGSSEAAWRKKAQGPGLVKKVKRFLFRTLGRQIIRRSPNALVVGDHPDRRREH